MRHKAIKITELVGLTMTKVESQGDEVYLHTDSGRRFVMAHEQDCCESVGIESITGDLEDLVGSPILVAEESVSDDWPDGAVRPWQSKEEPDSYTWTFYKLATIKGWVDIRWYGESNGYYSESVEIRECIPTWKEQRLL